MDHLIISIGQAGNQINYELSNLLLDETNNNTNYNFKTFNGDLLKNILIDTEKKVVKKYFSENKFYVNDINVITNSSGRGNNWSLGYSLDYKEIINKFNNNQSVNICIESLERINKFLERCDFMRGFMTIHSMNGGTGSGVTSRIVEMLKDEYNKFNFVDCPVIGLESKIYSLFYFS